MVLSGPARDDVVMSTDTPQDSPVWPPQPSSPAPAPQPSSAHQPAAWSAGPQEAVQQAEPQRIWTVLSETKRRGAWQVPERLVLPVVMGDVLVDLREATLTAPVTTLEVQGLMGEVKIVVPDGVRVECTGSPIMGEFEERSDAGLAQPTPGAPLVRVVGAMIMGQVRVFRTAAAVGTGAYAIDGMTGWKHRRRQRRSRD